MHGLWSITTSVQGRSLMTRVVIGNHKSQTNMHFVLYSLTWLVLVVISKYTHVHCILSEVACQKRGQ